MIYDFCEWQQESRFMSWETNQRQIFWLSWRISKRSLLSFALLRSPEVLLTSSPRCKQSQSLHLSFSASPRFFFHLNGLIDGSSSVLSLMGSFLGSYLWIEAVLVCFFFFFWASKLNLLLVIRLGSTLSYINVLYWFRQRLLSFWAAFCNKIKMKIICVQKMFKWFQVSSLPFFWGGGVMVLLLKFNIQATWTICFLVSVERKKLKA